MLRVLVGAVSAAGTAADGIMCAVEAAWPRSATNGELERLTSEGHEPGTFCDFDFVLALHPEQPEATLRDVREAGFTLDPDARRDGGYAIVRTTVPLRAFHLAWALARLNRAARRTGSFAEMLGPSAGSVPLGRLREAISGGELRTST